jgi:FkbM family methyltransferase
MARFYHNLQASWITNRFSVARWYYRKRFPFLGGNDAVCQVQITTPFEGRRCLLSFEGLEDAFQGLSVFGPANTWNGLDLIRDPQHIVDLGANRGYSTLYWSLRFPHANLHGVEMNAENAAACRSLFEANHRKATFHQIALSDRDGTNHFLSHSSHTRHRLTTLISDDSSDYSANETIEVTSQTFATFLASAGLSTVDILKVDIEGAEQFLLESIEAWSPAVKVILLEIHHNIDEDWARQQLHAGGYTVQSDYSEGRTEWLCRKENLPSS